MKLPDSLKVIIDELPPEYQKRSLVISGEVERKVSDDEITAKEAAKIVIKDTDERFKHQRELLKVEEKQEEKQLTFGDFEE